MSAAGSLLAGANLLELSPDHVDEGERIGFLHEDKAAALGRLMAVDGQRDPIKVVANKGNPDKPWRLVTGMHRLIGARIEGLTVFAIEVSGKPEDLADLEASENLHRRPLAPIERAKFTAALVQAARERIAREHGNLKQHQLAIRARWERVKGGEIQAEKALTEETNDTCAKIAHVYGWEESVGEALGMSRRSIHNDLQLFRLLIEPFPDVAEALSAHPVVGENASQLKAIAVVRDESARRRVIEALLADPEIGADDARIAAGVDRPAIPAPLPYQKHFNAIEGGWSRLGVGDRNRFLRDKFVTLLTEGQKRELRDRLNEELGVRDLEPTRVGVEQAANTLSEMVGVVNRLLDGEGVDDDELATLRRRAQGVVFDIPEEPEADEPLVFPSKATAQ
jgi:ParB-like chromosome segregation protein Spo0J